MNPQCLQLPLCPPAWRLLAPLSSAFSLGQRAREQCCLLLGFLSLWANACGLLCTKPSVSGAPTLGRGQGKQAPVLSLTAAPGLWVKEGLRAVRWVLSCLNLACEELSLGAEPVAGPWRGTLPLLERSRARQRAVVHREGWERAGLGPHLQPACSLVLGNCGRLGGDLRELGEEGGKWEAP